MLIDILLTIHFILLVLISLRVLSRDDLTAPARLAWIVILFVLPYFGVLVYWMFGEVHLGRNFAREREDIINKLRQHRPAVLGSDVALTLVVKPEYQASLCLFSKIHRLSDHDGQSRRADGRRS